MPDTNASKFDALVLRDNERLRQELATTETQLRIARMESPTELEAIRTQWEWRLANQEKQTRKKTARDAKEEAKTLKAQWENWCKTKKVYLGPNRMLVEGEAHFTKEQIDCACEIIRRADADNDTTRLFISSNRPGLDYQEYQKEYQKKFKNPDVLNIHNSMELEHRVLPAAAYSIARKCLFLERKLAFSCIKSHAYYKRCNAATGLQIQQACVGFFNRRFMYQVRRLFGGLDLRQKDGEPVILLGGNDDTADFRGLNVGSYEENEPKKLNEQTWLILTSSA